MMRPDAKVEKVYLYPKPVDFRKSMDGLAALVELDIKVAVFDPVLFVFLNRHRNRVKILYWERNGFFTHQADVDSTQTYRKVGEQLWTFVARCPSAAWASWITTMLDSLSAMLALLHALPCSPVCSTST